MKLMKIAAVCVLAVAASGCASIIRGTSEKFTVQSVPTGARAELSTGEVCAATPCTIRRTRNAPFTVTVSMPGYVTQTAAVRNPWSRNGTTTGIVGNIILGGAIGIGVDAATGANRDLTPNPLVVTLVAVPAPTPAPEPVASAAPAAQTVEGAPTTAVLR